jgi:protein ImuB
LPADTVEILAQLGITQIEQLLKLPRASLSTRFGATLLLRIDQLLGTAQEIIVPHRPPPEFSAERTLEYPLAKRDLVERILEELVEQLAAQLAQRQQGAVRLSCRFDCSPGRPLLLQAGLFQPSAHPRHLSDLLRMQLEQLTLSGPVGRITLAATLTAPLEIRQTELFEGARQAAARQSRLLIDRLSSRLGADAVLRPHLTADPLPECAVEYVPAVQATRQRSRSITAPGALHRPLMLRSPPEALEITGLASSGPPRRFFLNGHEHRIVHYDGPERIEGGWWRGRTVRRDYYRVQTEGGERYWLFRRLQDGQWFLHGEFA